MMATLGSLNSDLVLQNPLSFHTIRGLEGQRSYHLISVESLASLTPEVPQIATRVVRGLGRLGLVDCYTDELDRESVFGFKSDKVQEELGSAESIFIIANKLSWLVSKEAPPFMSDAPYFGEKSIALLELANQKAIEAAIPQIESPVIDYRDRKIEELELSGRAYNILRRRGIKGLEDLMLYSEESLGYIPGFGPTLMAEVRLGLFRLGVKLDAKEAVDTETILSKSEFGDPN